MKILFVIFLLFTPLFCHFLGAVDLVTHPDMESRFALRRLVSYISGNFRVAKKSIDVDILSDPLAIPGEPFVEKLPDKRIRITINPADDWTRDRGFCRKLISALLKLKTGSAAVNFEDLPDWFVFGIASVAQERIGYARLARNNHSFELMNSLVLHGAFRNPIAIIPLNISDLTPEEELFFLEYAKLAIHTLESARKLRHFAAVLTESRVILRSDFDKIATDCLKNSGAKFIAPEFRKELWGDLNPPPEDFSLKCFDEVYKVPVPELDNEEVPTGKIMQISLDALPELSERPDYSLLCRQASKGLLDVSYGESREVRQLLSQLREVFYQEAVAFEVYKKSRAQKQAISDPRSAAKKEAQKRDGGSIESFDSLMKEQGKNDFTELTRKFYKEKVLTAKTTGTRSNIVSGINSSTPVRSKAEPEKIRRLAELIRQALAERKALRLKLDETAAERRSIKESIRYRSLYLENDDDSIARWLEQVENCMR